MVEQPVYLTADGLAKAEERLEYLKATRRSEVAERIKQAKEYGDLSENSEYDDAKNEQAFIEGRIKEIQIMLRNARIVKDDEITGKTVSLGTVVELCELATGERFSYTIVGSAEADPLNFKISNESPIGKAILGRKKGDKVKVKVPSGIMEYEILSIEKSKKE